MVNQITLRVSPGTFGPAMRALGSDKQRAFVIAMLDLGNINFTAAALAAGYAEGPEGSASLRVTAHRLAHDERIQAAIQEEARRRLKSGAIMAVGHLLTIADNPAHKDQLKAVAMLLDRSGLHALSEHKVTVEHTSEDEKAALVRINERMTALGMDEDQRKKMLGQYNITDAEYTVVEPGASSQPDAKEEWEA